VIIWSFVLQPLALFAAQVRCPESTSTSPWRGCRSPVALYSWSPSAIHFDSTQTPTPVFIAQLHPLGVLSGYGVAGTPPLCRSRRARPDYARLDCWAQPLHMLRCRDVCCTTNRVRVASQEWRGQSACLAPNPSLCSSHRSGSSTRPLITGETNGYFGEAELPVFVRYLYHDARFRAIPHRCSWKISRKFWRPSDRCAWSRQNCCARKMTGASRWPVALRGMVVSLQTIDYIADWR